jgi:hypothetical protein
MSNSGCWTVDGVYAATMSTAQRHSEPERSFGRDGISGLVDAHRAQRARDVSRPSDADLAAAEKAADAALARLDRTRRRTGAPGDMLSAMRTGEYCP